MTDHKQPPSDASLHHKYKSTYLSALTHLSFHILVALISIYALYRFRSSLLLSMMIIPVIALLVVRSFIIFHDCGHNSYTPSSSLNHILGILMSTVILFPYSWSYRHHTHHLTNGNIDNTYNFDFNELVFHTVSSYGDLSSTKKKMFKVLQYPPLFFFVLPIVKFLFIERFFCVVFFWWKLARRPHNAFIVMEQLFNDAAIVCILYVCHVYGVLMHVLFAYAIAASIGAILFHNQHTYNPAYITKDGTKWNLRDSGLIGSSFIQVPRMLKFFTCGIEYHHIHHLNCKIPGYNLQAYHEEAERTSNVFDNVTKMRCVAQALEKKSGRNVGIACPT